MKPAGIYNFGVNLEADLKGFGFGGASSFGVGDAKAGKIKITETPPTPITSVRLTFTGSFVSITSSARSYSYIGPSSVVLVGDVDNGFGLTVSNGIDNGVPATVEFSLSLENGIWMIRVMAYPYSIRLSIFSASCDAMIGSYAYLGSWGRDSGNNLMGTTASFSNIVISSVE